MAISRLTRRKWKGKKLTKSFWWTWKSKRCYLSASCCLLSKQSCANFYKWTSGFWREKYIVQRIWKEKEKRLCKRSSICNVCINIREHLIIVIKLSVPKTNELSCFLIQSIIQERIVSNRFEEPCILWDRGAFTLLLS